MRDGRGGVTIGAHRDLGGPDVDELEQRALEGAKAHLRLVDLCGQRFVYQQPRPFSGTQYFYSVHVDLLNLV